MNNLRTYEEWSIFGTKKELSPDEEYQRQKREAEKDRIKNKPKPEVGGSGFGDSLVGRVVKGKKDQDLYGEEVWDDEEEEKVAGEVAKRNEYKYRLKTTSSSSCGSGGSHC